ncbi:MAG: DUF3105 domain-containing protein [Candidatus Dormibacteraeota bacterium]|nr:DUF3105 domain-containing protein [Candidatus Dormibacteraeota bacterium]
MTNARKSRESAREKVERMRAEQAAQARRRTIMIVSASLVVVLVLAGTITAVILNGGGPAVTIAGVQSFTEQRNHVDGKVTYPQTPPAGGNHSAVLLNCGIYTSPVPNENAVHDLEHGAVWVTYLPTLPAADIATLTKYAKGQTYLDLSPYPGLPAPVVVSAWGKQLRLTGASDPRLQSFVKKYKQGSQSPEPGAACAGGTGTPNG